MLPRWSRLALAAILAFGACPALATEARAARDDGRGRTACPCDDSGAPTLVVRGDGDDLAGTHGRFDTPLCEAAECAAGPREPQALVVDERDATDDVRTPAEPTWRLAPKTSPPA